MDADDEIRRIRQSAQETVAEISKLKSEKGDMATGTEILLAFLILQTHDESDDALDLLEVRDISWCGVMRADEVGDHQRRQAVVLA
jgi:DNA polymerase phi